MIERYELDVVITLDVNVTTSSIICVFAERSALTFLLRWIITFYER